MELEFNPDSNDDDEWQRFGEFIEREVLIRTIIRNINSGSLALELSISAEELINNQPKQNACLTPIIHNAVNILTETLLADIERLKE